MLSASSASCGVHRSKERWAAAGARAFSVSGVGAARQYQQAAASSSAPPTPEIETQRVHHTHRGCQLLAQRCDLLLQCLLPVARERRRKALQLLLQAGDRADVAARVC